MKTNKIDDKDEETRKFPKIDRFLKKMEKFWDEIIEPNDLEEVFAVFFVLALIIIVVLVILLILPVVIKLVSLWWNLIL